MSLAGGTRLSHYEVVAAIGAGGMGEVYRAHDERLRRDVAIKVLPAAVREDPQRLARFEHEARAAGGLNHPGILAVFDIGEHDGAPYIVMELLDGTTLRERLRGGPLPVRKAVAYAVQIAQALAAAHDAGVVHRDLKPDNLFVMRDGRIKILDFGLAKAMESSTRDTTLTADRTDSGAVLGTAGYMAPEQVRGKDVDHRADLFAVGVVLHEMLTGKAPFARDTPIDRALATLNEDPAPLSQGGGEVSPAVELIVRRCLEKSPEERFQSGRDLAFALQALSTSPGSGTLRAPEAVARRRWPVRTLAVVGILGGGVAVFELGRGSAPHDPPPATARPVAGGLTFQRVVRRPGLVSRARFAPDERTIIFSAHFDGDAATRVYAAVPGAIEPRSLTDRPADLIDVSPGGDMALGVVGSGDDQLARAPITGGEPRVLIDSFEDAAWAPGDGDALLVARKLEGKTRLELPLGKMLIETSGTIVSPRFSPDGIRIAFASAPDPDSYPFDLELADRTGHRHTVVHASSAIQALTWSPDGKEIWFTTQNQLHAVTVAGADRVVTEFPGPMVIEAVAHDGRALLLRRDGATHLAAHILGEHVDRDLTWQNGSYPAGLSADGTLLLLGESKLGQVYIRPTAGGPAVNLGPGMPLALSPDKRWALVAPAVPMIKTLDLVPTGVVPGSSGETRHVALGPIVEVTRATFVRGGAQLLVGGHEAGKPTRIWLVDLGGGAPPRPVGPEGVELARAVSPDASKAVGQDLTSGHFVIVPLDHGEPRPLGIDDLLDVPIAWSADGSFLFVLHRNRIDTDQDLVATIVKLDLATGRATPWLSFDHIRQSDNQSVRDVFVAQDGASYVYQYSQFESQLFLVNGLH